MTLTIVLSEMVGKEMVQKRRSISANYLVAGQTTHYRKEWLNAAAIELAKELEEERLRRIYPK